VWRMCHVSLCLAATPPWHYLHVWRPQTTRSHACRDGYDKRNYDKDGYDK